MTPFKTVTALHNFAQTVSGNFSCYCEQFHYVYPATILVTMHKGFPVEFNEIAPDDSPYGLPQIMFEPTI